MSSPLDRVLVELQGRRARLLELADPERSQVAVLVEELTDLSEHLLVADEELRVQQAELDAAREHLDRVLAERDAMWVSAPAARAVTDVQGVVRSTNRAVDALLRGPATRIVPRPVATWFVVPDRAAVRSAIGRVRSGGTETLRAHLNRPDGEPTSVEVTVEARAHGEDVTLCWEFREVTPGPVRPLRAVPDVAAGDPPAVHPPRAAPDVVGRLAAFAAALAEMPDPDDVAARIVAAAPTFVPAAVAAAVVTVRRGRVHTVVGDAAVVALVAEGDRWGDEPPVLTGGSVGSVMVTAMPGGHGRRHLLLAAAAQEVFDPTSADLAAAFTVHAGLALDRAHEVANLHDAVTSRQQIGEAVGVLVERHRLTPGVAFETLVKASQNSNTKLRDVARVVVETGEEPHRIRPA